MSSSPFGRQQTPPNRAKEIAASDDEGSDSGFSDNSLEDLYTLLGGSTRPQAASRDAQLNPATPQAKRAAHGCSGRLHKSPVAIIPKHKFDLKALAKDACRDTALQASSLRAQEPMRDRTAPPSTPAAASAAASGIPASHSVLSDIISSDKRKDAHRVIRAVQRADGGHQELRYCFFKTDFDGPAASSKPPPEAMKPPWSLLTKGSQQVREQNLVSGVPFHVVGCQGGMPESLFLWVLEEMCVAKSRLARTELCNLLIICPDQIAALFTPDLLQSLLERIGAEDASLGSEEIGVAKRGEDVYNGHDWSCLLAVLTLLKDITAALPLNTKKYALQVLLRMAMDRLIISNIDLDNQFEYTFQTLIDTIPPEEWDSFCHDTCTLLKNNFSSQCIRINALLCLPTSCHHAHDLRRRLAITFLFNDASLSRSPPEDVLTLQNVIDRLARPDLQVGPATEFAELRAAILILDMAVDDGSVIAFPSTESEDQFNARVDELAARLNEIWRRTNDTGMKLARTEAKSVVEWVQKRVTHTVRTRRKRPKSIFDLPGQQEQKRDLPRQQEFMKSFFRKQMPSPKPKPEPEPEPEPQPQPQRAKREDSSEPEEIVMDSIVVKGG